MLQQMRNNSEAIALRQLLIVNRRYEYSVNVFGVRRVNEFIKLTAKLYAEISFVAATQVWLEKKTFNISKREEDMTL